VDLGVPSWSGPGADRRKAAANRSSAAAQPGGAVRSWWVPGAWESRR